MIAVVLPAHQEEALIGRCLASIGAAAQDPVLEGEAVSVHVVLDRCSDGTGRIAAGLGAHVCAIQAGNVGRARRAGARMALREGARWLAFTDADSIVPPDWLSGQLRHGAQAFCGMVDADDWSAHPLRVARAFAQRHVRMPDHPHVHGANLGVSAQAYRACGGFRALATGEDAALVAALEARGVRIARSAWPLVRTSARLQARAPGGFSAYLAALGLELANGALGA